MLRKNKTLNLVLLITFLVFEAVLLVLVQVTSGERNDVVSFSAVLLSCLFFIFFIDKEKNYILTQIALIFTVCADIFLVLCEPMIQVPAMICFSVTQICYFLRIFLEHTTGKQRLVHLIVRIVAIVTALVVTAVVLKEKTNPLSLISLFYYANLIVNIVFAFIQFKKAPLFAIGLLLFLCCDTFVGIDMLPAFIAGMEPVSFGFNIAWLFYVPSQALLAISLLKLKDLKKE